MIATRPESTFFRLDTMCMGVCKGVVLGVSVLPPGREPICMGVCVSVSMCI